MTGLVGKSAELVHIWKEVNKLVAGAASGDKKAEEEVGVTKDDMTKMAA